MSESDAHLRLRSERDRTRVGWNGVTLCTVAPRALLLTWNRGTVSGSFSLDNFTVWAKGHLAQSGETFISLLCPPPTNRWVGGREKNLTFVGATTKSMLQRIPNRASPA